jgi:hypothetical protein
LDFRHVHLYRDPAVEVDEIASYVAETLPHCKVDVRGPFLHHWSFPAELLGRARVSDITQTFERQPKVHEDFDLYGRKVALYDGFVAQRLLAQAIPEGEAGHVHIIFTNLLACTFSGEDMRYHARTVICGTPSIISTTGIVEAPAKPREFYLAQRGLDDMLAAKRRLAGRFIDYGDSRMTAAATGYALQALFFFMTDGEPFCDDGSCRLYNAHWQEDLIRTINSPALCAKHAAILNKFNSTPAAR